MISNQFVTSWQTSAFAAAWLTVTTAALSSSYLCIHGSAGNGKEDDLSSCIALISDHYYCCPEDTYLFQQLKCSFQFHHLIHFTHFTILAVLLT